MSRTTTALKTPAAKRAATSTTKKSVGKTRGAKASKPAVAAPSPVKASPKREAAIELVCRPGGATMAEIEAATGWTSVAWMRRDYGMNIVRTKPAGGPAVFTHK